jgi:hypothetical protein
MNICSSVGSLTSNRRIFAVCAAKASSACASSPSFSVISAWPL